MASLRRFTNSWAALFTICFCFFCTFQSSWGHRPQKLIVTSAFIKLNTKHHHHPIGGTSDRRRQCLHETECSSALLNDDIQSTRSSAVLDVRGGSSYGGGGGDDDGYGNYPNNGGGDDNGKGYNNNDGYGYDDRGDQSAPSYNDRDRYHDEDYGRSGGTGDAVGSGYYDDEGRYHDGYDDRGGGRGSSPRRSKSKTKLPAALTGSNRKLGIIFLSAGAAFTALGITLFFNKTLMRLGNLLFVAGIPLMIGPGRTVGYFLQPKKARATGCLGVGILLVLVGHPVIGILLEVFGLLNLFGNMFPLVMMMAKNLPVVGGLFNGGGNGNGGGGSGGKRRESRYDDDDRYYDEGKGYERDSYRRDDYDRY